ncbi:MAG TPA: 50S ribosomal protein L21e [Candidatus Nanoarchaeia archaeon]|nr:50S ribosomal protein L21e [Candidatus Nanoarchaeia archaeon]
MVMRIRGKIGKGRHKLKRNYRDKGKISLDKFFQEFKEGEAVALKACSAYQKGIYMMRFHGRTGKIIGKQGNCYYVGISDGSVKKKLLVHPIHLKRIQSI